MMKKTLIVLMLAGLSVGGAACGAEEEGELNSLRGGIQNEDGEQDGDYGDDYIEIDEDDDYYGEGDEDDDCPEGHGEEACVAEFELWIEECILVAEIDPEGAEECFVAAEEYLGYCLEGDQGDEGDWVNPEEACFEEIEPWAMECEAIAEIDPEGAEECYMGLEEYLMYCLEGDHGDQYPDDGCFEIFEEVLLECEFVAEFDPEAAEECFIEAETILIECEGDHGDDQYPDEEVCFGVFEEILMECEYVAEVDPEGAEYCFMEAELFLDECLQGDHGGDELPGDECEELIEALVYECEMLAEVDPEGAEYCFMEAELIVDECYQGGGDDWVNPEEACLLEAEPWIEECILVAEFDPEGAEECFLGVEEFLAVCMEEGDGPIDEVHPEDECLQELEPWFEQCASIIDIDPEGAEECFMAADEALAACMGDVVIDLDGE